jgi:hypothetical protein
MSFSWGSVAVAVAVVSPEVDISKTESNTGIVARLGRLEGRTRTKDKTKEKSTR